MIKVGQRVFVVSNRKTFNVLECPKGHSFTVDDKGDKWCRCGVWECWDRSSNA